MWVETARELELPERLDVMDSTNAHFTKINKSTKVAVSRKIIAFVVVLFIGSIVGTYYATYYYACIHAAAPSEGEAVMLHKENCNPNSLETALPTQDSIIVSSRNATTSTPKPSVSEPVKDVRLPRSIVPDSYTLHLMPFIYENFTFAGQAIILVNVTETTRNVTLHSVDLHIDRDSLVIEATDRLVPVVNVLNDTDRQFVILQTGISLEAGRQYLVRIKFHGVLNDQMQGFYRSSYKMGNETRWIAATQFQATDARRAFPCFDEPALKATFQINIAHPRNMTTASNMPMLNQTQSIPNLEGYVWDHYAESVPMSTYLVAFLVSDFQKVSNGTLSIWSRRNSIQQTKFALQVGPSILTFFEEYFNLTFPLPKMDLVALPDFSAGAMENWGLITFRETTLLFEEGVSTLLNLQSVVIVIAHELSHQWFGNLVTPYWWTDLWLNEGFASYLEHIGTHAVRPQWRMMDQFVVHEMHNVFALDALQSSHPISVQVSNPDEINEIFDRISYGKGGAIIRMMEHFLTPDVFRHGLTNYLNERKYQSATQDDLWQALTQEAHSRKTLPESMSVKLIMDTWTLQTGFPVVTAERNYESRTVTIRQKRFVLDSTDNVEANTWWIPVTYSAGSNTPVRSLWMHDAPVVLRNVSADVWLVLNINQTGYYRVNYDKRNWQDITRALLKKDTYDRDFDPKNRAQLINDALGLASAGYIEYGIALNVTRYLVHETDYVPWKAALTGLDYMQTMFVRTGHFDKFSKYMNHLMSNIYARLGFHYRGDADSQLTAFNRKQIMMRACQLNNKDCVTNAALQFRNWKVTPNPDENNPVSPNNKAIVYCTAVRVGNEDDWEWLWQRYLSANVATEQEIIMSALGCSRETWVLNRYMEWAITAGSGVRRQDAFRVFSAVAENVVGRSLAFQFLKDNLNRIRDYLGSSMLTMTAIVKAATTKLSTVDELRELQAFAMDRGPELGAASRTIKQSIEQVGANIKWMENHFESILKWISNGDIYNS